MYKQNKDNAKLQLIYDETNISKDNCFKSLFEIILKLLLILISIYAITYFLLGIIIDKLSLEQQILLENSISKLIKKPDNITSDDDTARFNKIKKNILKSDNNFPKTSKLNIYLVKDETKNALCLPNGDIYITSSLYEKLTDDEMLTFVIAHEMAHYKNKDHLKNIRHKIAKSTITIFLSLAIPNDSTISNIADDGLEINELGFSRGCEKQADIYAGKILLVLYNNTIGGQKVLNTLREKTYPGILRLYATHPDIDSRIKVLRQLKQHHLKSGF